MGTKIQSVPPQNKLPQTFETSVDIEADVLWNSLKPRMTRPQDLAVGNDGSLYMLGVSTSFRGVSRRLVSLSTDQVYLLNDATMLDPAVTQVSAVPVDQVYLQGTNLSLKQGDRLLLVGKKTSSNGSDIKTKALTIRHAEDQAALSRTRLDLADNAAPPPVPSIPVWCC